MGALDSAAAEGSYIPKTSKLKINARLEPSVVTAGAKARLVVAIAPDLAVSSLSVPGMERVVTGLRARGVDQIVLAPRSFADSTPRSPTAPSPTTGAPWP